MAKRNWKIQNKLSRRIYEDLEEPIESILFNRGIKTKKDKLEFLDPDYDRDSYDPFMLLGMDNAVNTCLKAIENQNKICIFADYDADGITASVILIEFLKANQANVISYIPDRNNEGYGMNKSAVKYIKSQQADLIITVDCGISNKSEISYAKELGMEVIVIDHHHVPPQTPLDIDIVDPKQKGDPYPDKNLAGVGVAFKFLQAIASKLDNYDSQQLKWMMDLVAIGTIADCVPLLGENRMLSKFGLLVLSKTNRTGLKQLFHVGRIPIDQNCIPSSENISFQVAPRINAAGRMDHANVAQNLLLCNRTQESEARLLALEIEEKNSRRQKVTKEIVDEVRTRLQNSGVNQKFIIESSPHWELGVIGLASGKIADEYEKPTILLKELNGFYKGSGRSVEQFNLVEALENNKDILRKYGGHSQAAGLEIEKKYLQKLVQELNDLAESKIGDGFEKSLLIDYDISLAQITEKLFYELTMLEPFGERNKRPLFITKNLIVTETRAVGNGEKHLKMVFSENTTRNNPLTFDAIGFGLAHEHSDLKSGDVVDIVYHLDKNTWNGISRFQALLKDLRLSSH